MPMYNLIENSDNYSDTSGGLWQFKRGELPVTSTGNPDNVSTANSTSNINQVSLGHQPLMVVIDYLKM